VNVLSLSLFLRIESAVKSLVILLTIIESTVNTLSTSFCCRKASNVKDLSISLFFRIESKVKSILFECYNGLVKICELYFQKIDKMNNPNFEISLSNDEVFIGVKKIERYKEICFEYLNIYFETEEGSVKRIGSSRFTIICGDLTIDVWLNNGEFPLNMFYFFKKGNRRERMEKNEIFKILENIKERISQI